MGVLVTDIALNTAESANQVAEGILMAGISTLFSIYLQGKYITLANNYYKQYKKQRDFYYTQFQPGGELPFANEQFSIIPYVPDYVGVFHTGYFPPGILFLFRPEIANRAANVPLTWARHARMYGSTTEVAGSFAMDMASIADDWFSYMFRYEEHKRDVFNERRWANMMDSLSYGVKEAASVERGLATSFQIFDEASGQLVSSINAAGNGLATYVSQRKVFEKVMNTPAVEQKPQQSNFDRIFSSNFG